MILSANWPNIPVSDRALPKRGSCTVLHPYGRHHRPIRCWYDLAERVLESWSAAFRVVILVTIVVCGAAELAAKIGITGQMLSIIIEAWSCRRRVRRD